MNLQSLFCGVLLCISISALIIACLAYTKKVQKMPGHISTIGRNLPNGSVCME